MSEFGFWVKTLRAQIGGNPLRECSVCGCKIASSVCRRCGRPICAICHFHHGLCKSCAKTLGKLK